MVSQKQTFNIGKTAEELVPDTGNRTVYFFAIVLSLSMAAGIALLWTRLPTAVPLFFTQPWGQERLAAEPLIFLLPAVAVATVVVNIFLSSISRSTSPLLPRMLAVSSLVVAVALCLGFLGIAQSLLL